MLRIVERPLSLSFRKLRTVSSNQQEKQAEQIKFLTERKTTLTLSGKVTTRPEEIDLMSTCGGCGASGNTPSPGGAPRIDWSHYPCRSTVHHHAYSMPQQQQQNPTSCMLPYCAYCAANNRNYSSEGQFARFFSESSRGAFDTIEAFVMAVNSAANMLNSTHQAVYNSFRAVIGAMDEFAKLKTQISCLVNLTALLNWLRYIWRLLLRCLRLKGADGGMEETWMGIQRKLGVKPAWLLPSQHGTSNPFYWFPSLIFWLVAIGIPYLMYHSVAKIKTYAADEPMKWSTGLNDYYEAVATNDHDAEENNQISFKVDEILCIAPKEYQPRKRGYLLASTKDGKKMGLVPMKKVKLLRRIVTTPSTLYGEDAIRLFDDAFRSSQNDYFS